MHPILSLAANSVTLAFLPAVLLKRWWQAPPKDAWVCVRVDGPVEPISHPPRFWENHDKFTDLHALHRAASTSAKDQKIAGLLVFLEHIEGDIASAFALRDALLAWKQAGKKVIVFLPRGAGTRQLIAASGADRIIAAPATEIAAMGFAMEAPYIKGVLERIGLEPEVMAQGRFKTAGEFLVADEMSSAQREQVERLLDVTWNNTVDALAQGRSVGREEAERWINDGPWLASQAKCEGIIDDVMYAEDLLRSLAPPELQDIPDLELDAATISVGDYLHVRRSIFRPIAPKCIAVIEVLGTIVSKEPMEWLPMAVESHICEALREARTNPKVAGAVVFIDSRGGSASASQKILHEVRALAKLKPVVACMGDNAASGGYMVAAGAHSIVAQPTTVTGSIGVVSARVAASKLLDRVGVKMQTIKRGKHANIMSVARNLEPSEKEVLDRMMGAIYKDFVEAVAVGRGKEPADIEPLASGRVWIGSDALDNGLVDMMGGFETALSKVRELVASSTGKKADSLKPALFEVRSMPSLPTLIRGFLPGMVGRGAGVVWDLIALATVQGVAAWQGSPGSGSGDGAETRSESVWLWSPWGHC